MPRDSDVHLEDVLTSIGRIRDDTAGLSRQSFAADQRTVDAVVQPGDHRRDRGNREITLTSGRLSQLAPAAGRERGLRR